MSQKLPSKKFAKILGCVGIRCLRDVCFFFQIIALLGGEPSEKGPEPIAAISSRGDNIGNSISNSGISARYIHSIISSLF